MFACSKPESLLRIHNTVRQSFFISFSPPFKVASAPNGRFCKLLSDTARFISNSQHECLQSHQKLNSVPFTTILPSLSPIRYQFQTTKASLAYWPLSNSQFWSSGSLVLCTTGETPPCEASLSILIETHLIYAAAQLPARGRIGVSRDSPRLQKATPLRANNNPEEWLYSAILAIDKSTPFPSLPPSPRWRSLPFALWYRPTRLPFLSKEAVDGGGVSAGEVSAGQVPHPCS